MKHSYTILIIILFIVLILFWFSVRLTSLRIRIEELEKKSEFIDRHQSQIESLLPAVIKLLRWKNETIR